MHIESVCAKATLSLVHVGVKGYWSLEKLEPRNRHFHHPLHTRKSLQHRWIHGLQLTSTLFGSSRDTPIHMAALAGPQRPAASEAISSDTPNRVEVGESVDDHEVGDTESP